MTYGLYGKFSAQPGRRDHLVTYLLQVAKLLGRPMFVHRSRIRGLVGPLEHSSSLRRRRMLQRAEPV